MCTHTHGKSHHILCCSKAVKERKSTPWPETDGILCRGTKVGQEQISHQKQCEWEDGKAASLNYKNRKAISLKFYTQLHYLSKMKLKQSL